MFLVPICFLVNFLVIIVVNLQDFDELLCIAEQGDHRNIDMLVGDIYGGMYTAYGLPADLIASSFGKAARSTRSDTGIFCYCGGFYVDLFFGLADTLMGQV